jgi:hypothetical protein
MAQATAVCRINIVTGEHVTEIHDWPAHFRSGDQNLLELEGHLFRSGAQIVVLNSQAGQARFRLVEDAAELVIQERPAFEPLRTLRYVCEGLVDQPRA